MSAERTPTPWTARYNDYFWEVCSDNGIVAGLVESTSMLDRKDYGEANAEFIVRAVNSHDELVAALWRAMEELRLIRMKDCNVVYDITLRVAASLALANAEGRS